MGRRKKKKNFAVKIEKEEEEKMTECPKEPSEIEQKEEIIEKIDDDIDWNDFYKQRDEQINAEKSKMAKIHCIDCCNEFNVLLLYLKHYKLMHLQNGKSKDKHENTIECPCGYQNDSAFKFCIKCGWDLRLKLTENSKIKMDKVCVSEKLLNT